MHKNKNVVIGKIPIHGSNMYKNVQHNQLNKCPDLVEEMIIIKMTIIEMTIIEMTS